MEQVKMEMKRKIKGKNAKWMNFEDFQIFQGW